MKQPPLLRSFRHAANGLWHVLRTQRNMRLHVAAAFAVLVTAWWLELDTLRWSILLLTICGVLMGEVLNTAVEGLVDLLSPQFHERAKVAKDVSAGAVLLISTLSVGVGLLILGPPLWLKVTAWLMQPSSAP
jgi:diacylglycerol kinase